MESGGEGVGEGRPEHGTHTQTLSLRRRGILTRNSGVGAPDLTGRGPARTVNRMTSANHPGPKHRASGKVLTVLGPIEPAKAGITLTHEHLFIDFRAVFQEPEGVTARRMAREKISLENLWWVRYNWNSSQDNLVIEDEAVTIREAAEFFRDAAEAEVRARAFAPLRESTRILVTTLGDLAGAVGAAGLALRAPVGG